MPVELHEGGGASITGNATLGFQGIVLIGAIKLYLSTGGKVIPTRGVGPAQMRALASTFTGRTYKRSGQGLKAALKDLETLKAGKSLDELGEVKIVNQMVGGVAADLEGK